MSLTYDHATFRLTDASHFSRAALAGGAAGLALTGLGLLVDADRAYQAYLIAFAFWLSLALGALFFTMLHHLTGAVWSVVIRRLSESLTATLPALALLFIPVILGSRSLYAWTSPDPGDEILHHRAAYANLPFFLIRAVGYFLVWIWLARRLYRGSLAQDGGHREELTRAFRQVSAPGMVLFALTVTFAAFDWLMALDPHWYSTIYGVYFFAGSVMAALPLVALIIIILQRRGVLQQEITREHFHDLGKLTFAFMILWSYMAFSQYFLIWYANIPEETLWYHHRWGGPWTAVSWLLPLGHFAVPFIALMSRPAKRSPVVLGAVGVWLLAIHWVDLSWLILPNSGDPRPFYSWMDLAAMIGVGGVFLGLFWKRYAAHPLVPVGDPALAASIRFENR